MVPLAAASGAETVCPTVTGLSETVVIDGVSTTVMDSARVPATPTVSSARAVKLAVPAAVGVPERSPAPDRETPAGRLPAETDQVSAPVPPVAASDWE